MILLIRHAAHSHLGTILSGRTPGIGLSPKGRAQADALARRLEATTIDAVHASPVQRAQETAAAIAARHGLPVETVAALDEVDFGDWAGRGFAELAGDPRWDAWNAARASAPTPGGETMAQAQARAWNHIAQAAAVEAGRTIAMISHCDIIRAVLAGALGLSLDHLHRFDIGPASISRLVIGPWGEKVLSMNENCQ